MYKKNDDGNQKGGKKNLILNKDFLRILNWDFPWKIGNC